MSPLLNIIFPIKAIHFQLKLYYWNLTETFSLMPKNGTRRLKFFYVEINLSGGHLSVHRQYSPTP